MPRRGSIRPRNERVVLQVRTNSPDFMLANYSEYLEKCAQVDRLLASNRLA
jgi:hypothetical protein